MEKHSEGHRKSKIFAQMRIHLRRHEVSYVHINDVAHVRTYLQCAHFTTAALQIYSQLVVISGVFDMGPPYTP